MIDLFITRPFASLLALILIALLAYMAIYTGIYALTWACRFLIWLVPQLDAMAWAVLRLFGR